MTGTAYGGVAFDGTSILAGSNGVFMPQMIVAGTIVIDTTVDVSTNIELNGTLIFDVNTSSPSNTLVYGNGLIDYSGNLAVTNAGPPLVAGDIFQLFSASSYFDFPGFSSTSYQPLSYGLEWVDNTATDGSIEVVADVPAINYFHHAGQLTLSWDTGDYPGFRVEAQTNKTGIGTNWSDAGSGGISPFTVTINPANPPVFFRLVNP
jgi:hypothetical protein